MTRVDKIRRTGNAESALRFLTTILGEGKDAERRTLPTPILKVKGPEKFRHGGRHIPVEQYAFQVDGKTYERFADAASVVLQKHEVSLTNPAADDLQEYVKRAYAIINGAEKIRLVTELPADFKIAEETALTIDESDDVIGQGLNEGAACG